MEWIRLTLVKSETRTVSDLWLYLAMRFMKSILPCAVSDDVVMTSRFGSN